MPSSSRVLPFVPPTRLQAAPPAADPLSAGVLAGASAAMERLRAQVRTVAPHVRTVLLTGAPGSGAEAVAAALHALSPLRQRPLLTLAPERAEAGLTDPELHSAVRLGATVFGPSIDRFNPASQSGLVRLMQNARPRHLCVIASSERDLRSLVGSGTFSATLAAALGSVRIALPTLRERREDLPALMANLLQELAPESRPSLTDAFLEAAAAFAWPRNLDQLREVVQWLAQHRAGAEVFADDLQLALQASDAPAATGSSVRLVRLEQVVQEHVRGVLVGCAGNKLRAAEVLGISRSTLYRMLDAGDASSFAMAS